MGICINSQNVYTFLENAYMLCAKNAFNIQARETYYLYLF
jgi:hypothetical protein